MFEHLTEIDSFFSFVCVSFEKIQNEHVLDLNAETGHTAWGSLAELLHVRMISTLHFRVACALFVLLFSVWLERM